MMTKQQGYMPDLSALSLAEFKRMLRTGRLLPSRRPLLDDIDAQFARLEKEGLANVHDLQSALSSATKLKRLAAQTGVPENYLKLLRREVISSLPTPVRFRDVPNLASEAVEKLEALEIPDTEALFPRVCTAAARRKLAEETGFTAAEILWLTRLVDVSRIKWVGPKLARLIVDTEYDSVEKLAAAGPQALLKALNRAKARHGAYKGALGIDDIESWVRLVVRNTPLVIEY
jgi:hypothetical protein